MDERFALLIDAENISPRYANPILNELAKYGKVTYKRVYGDWTDPSSINWKTEALENSITPIQQFRYVQGKNASDSAMIIDAMDMLYTERLEGFCLVSSDSDFTRLASRLREAGMMVIGMGEKKTPQALRGACDIFTLLETLVDEDQEPEQADDEEKKDRSIVSITRLERDIIGIIRENEEKNKRTGLGEIGSRLVKLYPEFDVRRYGYSLLSKFIDTFSKLKMVTEDNSRFVELRNDAEKDDVITFIENRVQQAGSQGIDLGFLGQKVRGYHKDFELKDYGYTQFYKFVDSIDTITIHKTNNKVYAKYDKL